MMKDILGSNKGIGLRGAVGLAFVLLTLPSLMACFAFIPPIVNAYKTRDSYVATVSLKVKAEKVYSELVSVAEQKASERKIKITNKAPEILFLEVEDGVQTAGIKVNKVGEGMSNMVITATIPDTKGVSMELDKNREKELAVRIATNVCQAFHQDCQLSEQ